MSSGFAVTDEEVSINDRGVHNRSVPTSMPAQNTVTRRVIQFLCQLPDRQQEQKQKADYQP